MSDDVKKQFNQYITAETDNLPRWNFDQFYPGVDSQEFEDDVQKVTKMVDDFTDLYQGEIDNLSGNELAEAIQEYKDIGALFGKLYTYVGLKAVQDNQKYGPAEGAFQMKAAPLSSKLAFFGHEIKQLDEGDLQASLKTSRRLMAFEPWLDNVRRAIPHTPPLDVQQYAGELSAESGWTKLFDDRHIAKRYPFEGEELNESEILNILSSDPDQKRRAAAHQVFQDEMKKDAWLFTHIHNELMRMKSVDDRWTKSENPWDARHFSNNVAPEVVDALETAVKDSYARISHRFYALKAKLMRQSHLNIYDRNVNVFEGGSKKYIPFEDAKNMVLKAYRRFSPKMADEAEKFFDEGWIDAPVDDNKRSGAFAHPGGAYLAHPMVMLNYQGSPRDVATMAHELGHGVHQSFAAHKGDAIVNALYRVYEEGNVPDFEEKYIKMLEAGGTLKPQDLEDMFGLDITDPAFWDKGLQVIEDMLDELEDLCEPLLKQQAQPKPQEPKL